MTTFVETWRVSDLAPAAPAHLIAFDERRVKATACRWLLPTPGFLMSRAQMVAGQRFVCICCARAALAR